MEAEGDARKHPGNGRLNAAIARATVRTHSEYRGRGPTKARCFYRQNVVVVLLEGTMTKGERRLSEDGEGDAVIDVRETYQGAMREKYVSNVELLTGRKVIAFMSANHVEPDLAVEVFVLDASVEEAPLPLTPTRNSRY